MIMINYVLDENKGGYIRPSVLPFVFLDAYRCSFVQSGNVGRFHLHKNPFAPLLRRYGSLTVSVRQRWEENGAPYCYACPPRSLLRIPWTRHSSAYQSGTCFLAGQPSPGKRKLLRQLVAAELAFEDCCHCPGD